MALTGFFADVFYVNCHKDMSRHSLKMICLLLPKKVGRYLKKNWGIAFISVCTKQNIQVLNFSMVDNQISLQLHFAPAYSVCTIKEFSTPTYVDFYSCLLIYLFR